MQVLLCREQRTLLRLATQKICVTGRLQQTLSYWMASLDVAIYLTIQKCMEKN